MGALQRLNEEFICRMKEEPGVLGAWEFGSGMHGTRDAYSDIDIVFLVAESDYFRIDGKLKEILEGACDDVVIFWPEDFNGESIRNYDCLVEREGKLLQYDIFLLNDARLDDGMCRVHYADLREENIYYDREGKVRALIGGVTDRGPWREDVMRLIDTYWLHINMTAKYFLRQDYFKLEGVFRILMDVHVSLLLTAYDETVWGGTANKLHYLPEEKRNHLKKYYCDADLDQVKDNLWQEMQWFEEDVRELYAGEAERRHSEISGKVKREWKSLLGCANCL